MNNSPQNILFVCYGNMCRSPMAEGLAKEILDGRAHVESAGISPSRNRATDEAIEVMKDEFSIDISNHRTRAVSDMDVAPFDTLIALDTYVYSQLKRDQRIDPQKLILWDIHDPYMSSIKVYRECALHIRRCVEGLVGDPPS